jgi:hypothetical protein
LVVLAAHGILAKKAAKVVWAKAMLAKAMLVSPAKVMPVASAMLAASGMSAASALSMVSVISMVREMVAEFQREKALLLVPLAVLASNEMEREVQRREKKVAVPPPCPHLSIVPTHIFA